MENFENTVQCVPCKGVGHTFRSINMGMYGGCSVTLYEGVCQQCRGEGRLPKVPDFKLVSANDNTVVH